MAVSEQLSPERAPGAPAPADPLMECLALITRWHGRPVSVDALMSGLPLAPPEGSPELVVRAAERHGYAARVAKQPLRRLSRLLLPAILLLDDGRACVLSALEPDGSARVLLPESGGGEQVTPLAELESGYSGRCVFVQPRPRADGRADIEPERARRGWFWATLWRFRRYYFEAMIAAALVNVLALATSLYVMNVYDRVVPNNAFETLVVLATGTVLAVAFEFLARTLRAYFLDFAGKKADVLLASRLFQQALGLRMEERPASAGAFAAHLREFESLRDFITSATLTVLSDLPFVFFFVWVISLIGAPLHLVPLAAVPLVVLVGLLAQAPLAALMRRHLRESALKHGVLVEAVEGADTLKTLCAERVMQGRWENYTALTASSATRSRLISSLVVHFAAAAQQIVTILVVVWGVYLIAAGELTVGALIACVILSGRALAPVGQVAGLMVRYQHARAAYFTLDALMAKEIERPAERRFVHRERLSGAIELERVSFAYPGEDRLALDEVTLRIRPGEKVAILGRVGSGKSTLLKLIVGLYRPRSGAVLVDGTDLAQIDPVDLRRNLGYVAQDARLFHGTLRDNIVLGVPHADDAAVLEAAELAGIHAWVGRHPLGYDLGVGERGEGLSGGQRQGVALARTLLAAPPVLLLDEPTSDMDFNTEQALMSRLASFAAPRTLLLVTHKPSLLPLTERIVVLEAGRIVADGPRDTVLKALSTPLQAAPGRPQGGGRGA